MRPLKHIVPLSLIVALSLSSATIHPMDDHGNYRRFIETLATGQIDFSIPGFHGASFLALPIYLVTQSPLTNIYFQILCALFLVPMGYFAVSALLRDKVSGILFAYILSMSPFFFFLVFRGFTFASFTLMVFAAIYLYSRQSRFTWFPLGMSFITKPFSIALAPLMLLWPESKPSRSLRSPWVQLGFALIIPLVYIVAEYAQIGRIIVGSHVEIDQSSVFTSGRVFLNIAHGIQMLFSVHNYYFPNPAMTGPGNLVHSSPILMFLGVFALLYPKMFFSNMRFAWGMRLSVITAYMLVALLDHMDHFYMQMTVILLLVSSLATLRKFPLLIPLVLATLHFQWLYAYLNFVDSFSLTTTFFVVPVFVDIVFVVWCMMHVDNLKLYLSGESMSKPEDTTVLAV